MPSVPRLSRSASLDAIVPAAIMAVVLMMVLPVPPLLLDLLISCNITLSVVTVIATMYIERPVELSVYPSLLLLLTLLRLALNISSTRLILMNGQNGEGAAGEVIRAFGDFVVGGNFVVGIVIFILLIAIQYVVINHGAVRISEVTARFTLDALPGKQMAIDADLNAGLINESEARQRRENVSREAEFYGAMDGAVRFTQRDAIASIIITCVNILAGFLIGALSHGMAVSDALETYTVLTVGDGLVTVIPALLISVSGGIITTRAAGESSLSVDFGKQLFGRPEPLLLAAGVMGSLAAVPGLPAAPFLLLGSSAATAGWRLRKKETTPVLAVTDVARPKEPENVESLLRIEPLAIEVGLGLVKIVDAAQGGALLARIAGVRRQLAQELGFVLPPVRVTDNLQLKPREYVMNLKGIEIARYELHSDSVLAIKAGHGKGTLEGIACKEPAFGMDGLWVPQEQSDKARLLGYTVVDAANVVATHLTEIIRRHAHELFSRQDTDGLLQRIKDENPKLIEDLVPQLMSLSIVQKVMQNLLRERVSIRDAVSILEALSEAGTATKNPTLLTEYVRQALSRSIARPYLDDNGDMPAYLLGPALESILQSGIEHNEQGSRLVLDPTALADVARKIGKTIGQLHSPTPLVCSSSVRFAVRQLVEHDVPLLAAISHAEVPPNIRVISLGTVG